VVGEMRHSQNMLLLAVAFLSFILFRKGGKLKADFLYSLAAISVISFAAQYFHFSANVIMQFIFVNVGLILIPHFISNFEGNYRPILAGMAVACIIQSTWIILNHLGFDPYSLYVHASKMTPTANGLIQSDGPVLEGSMGNPAVSSALIACTIPSLFRRKWICALPVCLIGLYFGNSAMSMLSFIVGLFFCCCVFKKRYKTLLAGFLISVGLLIIFRNHPFLADNERFAVWLNCLKMNEGLQILWGHGPGFFADNFHKIFNMKQKFIQAHNEYLEAYVMFGVIGLACIANLLRKITINNKLIFISLVIFLLNSVGFFTLHIAGTAVIGLITYALSVKKEQAWH